MSPQIHGGLGEVKIASPQHITRRNNAIGARGSHADLGESGLA